MRSPGRAPRIVAAPFFALVLLLGAFLPPARASDRPRDLLAAAFEVLAAESRTGVILDRVVELHGAERFDGLPGAPAADAAILRRLRGGLALATGAARPAAYATGADGAVRIAVIDREVERVRDDALASGALVTVGDRLARGAGPALVASRLFAASALRSRTFRGAEARFVVAREDWLGDDAPAAVAIDFDDGLGARTIALDRPVVVRWNATGTRTVRLWSNAGGATRQASFAIRVEALGTPAPDDTLHVTATIPYGGQFGTGDAYVALAPGHAQIVNPVVVVEGFDLENSMNWDELYALLNGENLIESLRADGYDAIVLNFTDATDAIQKNAFVLAALLDEIEAAIAPGQTVALVGASMGGLVSRYALAYLEHHGLGHPVRTFISFDVPHGGANIPLGIQYWVEWFADLSSQSAALRDLLNRPAARQMLTYHFTEPPTSSAQTDAQRAALLADFAAVGDWPAGPRLVAVANGSGAQQTQGFAAGEQIVRYEFSNLFVTIRGNVWALRDLASGAIFDGRIRIVFDDQTRVVTVSGARPIDHAPGGSRATMAEMDAVAAPFGDIIALHPAHDFIPTISALALDSSDLFYDIAGDPNLLSHTPFDAVYFPVVNQEHVAITPENAAWFRAEIAAGTTGVGDGPRGPVAAIAGAPNPFSRSTRIAFRLAAAGHARVSVHDVSGRRVATLADGAFAAGPHEVAWNGRDADGRPAPAGVYFARLGQPQGSAVARVVKVE